MAKKVTLQMIADRAGVSIMTVSNVLSGKKGASEEVRNMVLAIAQEIGYRNNPVKKKEKGHLCRIGVMIAERYVKEYPSLYMNIYKQITQKVAQQDGLTILEVVNEAREKLEEKSSVFERVAVQGILIIGEMNPEFVDMVDNEGEIPVVCVDFYNVDNGLDSIITDGFRGMQMATQRLLDAGHRDIAFVGTPEATNSIMDRYMGYCKALFVNHIPEGLLIYDRKNSRYASEIDIELPEKLPTAFVCNCERSACLLVEKLRDRGVQIPEDVSIVAFDRFQKENIYGLELTTYECDEEVMAEISVATLVKRIEGNQKTKGIRMVEGAMKNGNTVKSRGEQSWPEA